MWKLGQKAEKYGKLPSELFPGLVDEWAIYCFDNAVNYFMLVMQNALQERKEVGAGKQKVWREVYTLEQLLNDDFRLPRPTPAASKPPLSGIAQLMALAKQGPSSGVKLWEYKPS